MDILAYRDPLGTEDLRIKVQVQQRPDAKTSLDRLVELWIEHYDRVEETKRALLPLKPVWFLDPPT